MAFSKIRKRKYKTNLKTFLNKIRKVLKVLQKDIKDDAQINHDRFYKIWLQIQEE